MLDHIFITVDLFELMGLVVFLLLVAFVVIAAPIIWVIDRYDAWQRRRRYLKAELAEGLEEP
jgi:hypothetical protein